MNIKDLPENIRYHLGTCEKRSLIKWIENTVIKGVFEDVISLEAQEWDDFKKGKKMYILA